VAPRGWHSGTESAKAIATLRPSGQCRGLPRRAPAPAPRRPYDPAITLASSVSTGAATAWVIAAYLVGTFPTAVLVARRRGVDPTRSGSGNPGATNVLRTAGRRAGAVTLLGDVAKGALAAGVGWAVGGHGLGVACGVAAVAGHVVPATRGFRGGKGVATGAGMAVVLFPLAFAFAAAGFAVGTAVSRTASLGSIVAAVVLPIAAGLLGAPGGEVAALAGCAVLIVGRHRANIARLVRGTEPRLGGSGSPARGNGVA
jgi:acyl phosphate:glycerol-3-phosphate acyltransferase